MTTATDPTAAPAGTPPVDGTPTATPDPVLLGAADPVVDPAAAPDPAATPTDPVAKPADPPPAEAVYDFKAPEGVEFDVPHLQKFTALAKELKLSPEDAQKAVDLVGQMELERVQQHAETVKGWLDAVKTDKELGGDKLAENLAVAKKTFDLLPKEQAAELKSLLNQTGLEAHPTFFRLFHAVGKALSEDGFTPSGRPTPVAKTQAERLYPTSQAH